MDARDRWAGDTGVPMSLDEAVASALVVVAAVLLLWLALGYLAALLGALPGGIGRACDGFAQHYSPTLARRLAAITLSIGGAGIALAGPASAAPIAAPPVAAAPVAGPSIVAPAGGGQMAGVAHTTSGGTGAVAVPSADSAPDPGWSTTSEPVRSGWTPRSAPVRHQPDAALVSGRSGAQPERSEVVVHRGDSLWSIAAAHAGRGATVIEVAAAVPVWHEANAEVIGANPDALLPGQRLAVPSAADLAAAPLPTGSAR